MLVYRGERKGSVMMSFKGKEAVDYRLSYFVSPCA